MKTRLAALVILLALPASAETPDDGVGEGLGLLQEGARIIMRSILEDIEPQLDEMRRDLEGAMAELEPRLDALADMIGNIDAYEAPERLPNGDIILRRKRDVPGQIFGPNGETEI